MTAHTNEQSARKRSGGFTLIEILTVVAIILILTAISSLVLTRSDQDITRASTAISDLLQQARTHAMSNNNYVYVGFSETTGHPPRLAVAVLETTDGLSSRTSSLDSNQVQAIRKLTLLQGVQLDTSTANDRLTGNPLAPSPDSQIENVEGSPITFPATIITSRADIPNFGSVIQFSPDGAARLSSNDRNVPDFITLGLVPSTGEGANVVGLIIDGPSGAIRVIRPGVNSEENPDDV